MDALSLIAQIQRSDDAEWLRDLREEVADDVELSEADRMEVESAIDRRFSQLNAMAMGETKARW